MPNEILELIRKEKPQDILEYVRALVSTDALKQSQESILSCKGCGLSETTPIKTTPWGNPNPVLMVLGDVPHVTQATVKGEVAGAFDGTEGFAFLKQIWEHYGVDQNKVLYANTVNCLPRSMESGISLPRIPRSSECKMCKASLFRTIRLANPQKILILGSTPLSLFSSLTLCEQRAKEDPWLEVCGIPALVTHHPQYLYDYGGSLSESMFEQMNNDFLLDVGTMLSSLSEVPDFLKQDKLKEVSA